MNASTELHHDPIKQYEGAQQAKALLTAIQTEVRRAKGDFAIKNVARMISKALDVAANQDEAERYGFATALGDFIGSTLEGCQPSIEEWNPLSRIAA